MLSIKIVNNEYIPDIKNLSFIDIENRQIKYLIQSMKKIQQKSLEIMYDFFRRVNK
ncbi:hypothetical protein [Malaciobacter canalis]|uniref:hypothetical protein n=1 Tax=Malaciobacter canalis TaxID=1912871 RepID=UPI0013FD83BD|nr:hypothetical protein [Malaciobacter canalis]